MQESSSLLDVVGHNEGLSIDVLRTAYRENLEIVLDEVEKLVSELEGRTVITADHGEMLGDRHDFIPMRDYGHHPGIYNDATVTVPWHVIETGELGTITSERPAESPDVDGDAVREQLERLGYRM